jgi:drug/metabolite transporter (DMT)-like permease
MIPTLARRSKQAYLLGVLGVVIFAITFPMTRLAVGTVDAPQLSPWFSALGRAAVAGILSLCYLVLTRTPKPERSDWLPLALTSVCIVFGFPILTTWALRYVESIHASVLYGFLPLMTAAIGAVMMRQRPSIGFWLCAALGSVLVVAYAAIRNDSTWIIHPADFLLFAAMVFAAYGYAKGAQVTARLGAERVICWALVISLPITLPVALMLWPDKAIANSAWMGFAYIAVFSMWLGFFAWYRALALGGTVRISQIQLIQPFLSMAFSVPLLGERLDLMTLGFAVAVIVTVFIGKKL